MFEPVTRNVFRWEMTDQEYGEIVVGHLLLKDGSAVLIDPPAFGNIIPMVKILGKPEAVLLTTTHHRRGAPYLSRMMGVPLFVPDPSANNRKGATPLDDSFKDAKKYNEKTKLPLGLKAHTLHATYNKGEVAISEMAVQFGDFLIVGDAAWGDNGKVVYFPTGVFPDKGGARAKAIGNAFRPIAKASKAKGLLGGHKKDLESGLQKAI